MSFWNITNPNLDTNPEFYRQFLAKFMPDMYNLFEMFQNSSSYKKNRLE